jgi:hypothetical protein
MPDGTKERILNVMAQEPKTMSQIAAAVGLSVPTVHSHVREMLSSEILRESEQWEKTHPAERYYEPNFPVINEEDCTELQQVCGELAAQIAALFKKHERQLKRAFGTTPLPTQGWSFAEVAQCVYAQVQRGAREQLEHDGTLVRPRPHRNGIEWVFWAVRPEDRNE